MNLTTTQPASGPHIPAASEPWAARQVPCGTGRSPSVQAETGPGIERRPHWQWGGGGLLLALFGWCAFGRGTRVPLLGWIDLAIHEFGHVATFVLPEVVRAAMGNGTQTLLPLGLAAVFGLRERNWLGVVVCLGWAATTMQDASVYIADAPYQRLHLIGGYHDWAFVLGESGRLDQAESLARLVWTGGLMLWVVAAAGCATGPWVECAVVHGVRRPRTATAASPSPDSPRSPATSIPATGDWRDYYGS